MKRNWVIMLRKKAKAATKARHLLVLQRRVLPLSAFVAFELPPLMSLLFPPLRALGNHFGDVYIRTALFPPRLEELEVTINSILGPPQKWVPYAVSTDLLNYKKYHLK
jgi:hypothetical protein